MEPKEDPLKCSRAKNKQQKKRSISSHQTFMTTDMLKSEGMQNKYLKRKKKSQISSRNICSIHGSSTLMHKRIPQKMMLCLKE